MTEWDAIVLDLDGGERLDRCLVSIELQDPPPDRVIVVDNGSRVPVAERIESRGLRLELIRLEENAGFAGGVNRGWAETRSPLVALINNDVVLRPGWSQALVGALEADSQAGAAQTVVADPRGKIDGAGIEIVAGRVRQLGHGASLEVALEDPWGVSATAALYRRDAVEAVGRQVFEPILFAYYEDVELAARLDEAGWRSVLERRPLAIHEGSATGGRLGLRREFLRARNRHLVARLHPRLLHRGALLGEDLRIAVRFALRLQLGRCAATIVGLLAGTLRRLPQRAESGGVSL